MRTVCCVCCKYDKRHGPSLPAIPVRLLWDPPEIEVKLSGHASVLEKRCVLLLFGCCLRLIDACADAFLVAFAAGAFFGLGMLLAHGVASCLLLVALNLCQDGSWNTIIYSNITGLPVMMLHCRPSSLPRARLKRISGMNPFGVGEG